MKMGEAAKAARIRKGMTIRELSARSGVHVNTIIDFEKDRITIKVNTAEYLAHALGIGMDEYLGSYIEKRAKAKKK